MQGRKPGLRGHIISHCLQSHSKEQEESPLGSCKALCEKLQQPELRHGENGCRFERDERVETEKLEIRILDVY